MGRDAEQTQRAETERDCPRGPRLRGEERRGRRPAVPHAGTSLAGSFGLIYWPRATGAPSGLCVAFCSALGLQVEPWAALVLGGAGSGPRGSPARAAGLAFRLPPSLAPSLEAPRGAQGLDPRLGRLLPTPSGTPGAPLGSEGRREGGGKSPSGAGPGVSGVRSPPRCPWPGRWGCHAVSLSRPHLESQCLPRITEKSKAILSVGLYTACLIYIGYTFLF